MVASKTQLIVLPQYCRGLERKARRRGHGTTWASLLLVRGVLMATALNILNLRTAFRFPPLASDMHGATL